MKWLKKEDLNVMANIKIIEELKANLLCIIGEFFSLLTRGTNIAQDAILNCISGAILILYVLVQKLGYSCKEVEITTFYITINSCVVNASAFIVGYISF